MAWMGAHETRGGAVPVILLIENDEADIFLFRRALAQLNFPGAVQVVGSVSEARDYLEGHDKFPTGDIIRVRT